MKFKTASSAIFRRVSPAGFTLVEMMMSVVAGTLLLGAVVALMIFTGKSFFMMGSYVDLDMQSRAAVDTMGREIRNSSLLLTNYSSASSQYLKLTNATSQSIDYISYYPGNGTLMWTNIQSGTRKVQMLLTNCDSWSYSLYTRVITPTSTDIVSYTTTSPSSCKMINMTWHCYRNMLGAKFTTEIVQTAQIVLRNKVN